MPTQSLTAEQLSMRGRMGGLITASRHDSAELIRPNREKSPANPRYFEKQVDPEGVLPEDERKRRAAAARKAHYTRLAYRSAQVRKARAG